MPGTWQCHVRVLSAAGLSQDGEGRVLAYQHGTWGTVCADQWDQADAQVLCGHWGYAGGQAGWLPRDWNRTHVLFDVRCWGWEAQLAQCPFSSWDVTGNCSSFPSSGDAAVWCYQQQQPAVGASEYMEWCGLGLGCVSVCSLSCPQADLHQTCAWPS